MGLWIAAIAFIAGACKILDDYHLKRGTRTALQEVLTRWFVVLDTVPIPDLLGRFFRVVSSPAVALGVLLLCGYWTSQASKILVFALFDTISTPDIVGDIYGPLRTAVPWINLAVALTSLGLTLWNLRRASTHASTRGRRISIAIALLAPLLVDVVGVLAVYVAYLPDIRVALLCNGVGLVVSMAITFMAGLVAALLTIAKTVLAATRYVLMSIFDAASDPKKSPLTYFSGLLNTGLLFVKLLLEITDRWQLPFPNTTALVGTWINMLLPAVVTGGIG